MGRQKIVAGNWKMNLALTEASQLVENILLTETDGKITTLLFCAFPYLQSIGNQIKNKSNFFLGAQNCHTKNTGAFTGEVSAMMLQSVGCKYVLIGHSERRAYFNETSEELTLKINEALLQNLKPVFCIGETLDQREGNFYFDAIKSQLKEVLSNFTETEFKNIIIAYEPVWAIGSGLTATSAQAQEMHAYIRNEISTLFSFDIAQKTSILYGGSCNSKNAKELFSCPDVDGGLIGGASLKADEFCCIINSF